MLDKTEWGSIPPRRAFRVKAWIHRAVELPCPGHMTRGRIQMQRGVEMMAFRINQGGEVYKKDSRESAKLILGHQTLASSAVSAARS